MLQPPALPHDEDRLCNIIQVFPPQWGFVKGVSATDDCPSACRKECVDSIPTYRTDSIYASSISAARARLKSTSWRTWNIYVTNTFGNLSNWNVYLFSINVEEDRRKDRCHPFCGYGDILISRHFVGQRPQDTWRWWRVSRRSNPLRIQETNKDIR